MTTHTIDIPAFGETITKVKLSKWYKEDGDWVQEGQPILEVESDKLVFELTAEISGKLHILVKKGQNVAVGTAIANIEVPSSE